MLNGIGIILGGLFSMIGVGLGFLAYLTYIVDPQHLWSNWGPLAELFLLFFRFGLFLIWRSIPGKKVK